MNTSLDVLDRCQELLIQQEQALRIFFDSFDFSPLRLLVKKLSSHRGKLFFSGIGKSHCIAQKIVATLQSFGEQAFLLSSGGLLHGDIGVVQTGDVVCLLSKSGETQEILDWIPCLKERRVHLIGFTSSRTSRLALACDEIVLLPMVPELDPFNLMPTNSTVVQLLVGDLLAMMLLHARQTPLSTFGRNHPGGQIGLKANAKIKDYIYSKEDVPFCSPTATVQASLNIFSAFGHGCVCVVGEDETLLGIFTDGDLRRALEKFQGDVLDKTLLEVMTTHPKTIYRDADVITALQLMEQGKPITMLPVVDYDQRVVGLLHMHVLARAGFVSSHTTNRKE